MITVGVLGFIAGVAFDQFMHWMFGAPSESTASTTCVHCEAPRRAHDEKDTECPVRFDNGAGSFTRMHFFKPMTAEQWMKYRGIEDAGDMP